MISFEFISLFTLKRTQSDASSTYVLSQELVGEGSGHTRKGGEQWMLLG